MPGELTLEGLKFFLEAAHTEYYGWYVGLFQNDFTPDERTSIDELVECDFGNYQRRTIPFWGAQMIEQAERAVVYAAPLEWYVSGPPYDNLVYGYFLVHGAGTLVGAERFAGPPYPMEIISRYFRLQLKLTLDNYGDPPPPGSRVALRVVPETGVSKIAEGG